MLLRASDPDTREATSEVIEITIGAASRLAADLARVQFVRDAETLDGRGRITRQWMSLRGDPLDIEAMARVNPVSAALFNLCNLVLTERQEGDRTKPRDRWDWLRKSDGALMTQETDTRSR